MKNHSCRTTWWAATVGGAEPGGHRGRGQEAGLEGEAAGEQVAAHGELRAQQRGHGRSDTGSAAGATARSRCSASRNSPAPTAWPTTLADGRPDEPQARDAPRPCTSGAHSTADSAVARQHVPQRPGGVLHAAHPAVARPASPAPAAPRTAPPAATTPRPAATAPPSPSARATGPATSCPTPSTSSPTASASHVACTPSPTAAARRPGAVQPGGAGGRAVGQEVELPGDLREQHGGDGQARPAGPRPAGRRRPCRPAGRAAPRPAPAARVRPGARSRAAAPGRAPPRHGHPRAPADVDERGRHVAPHRGGDDAPRRTSRAASGGTAAPPPAPCRGGRRTW